MKFLKQLWKDKFKWRMWFKLITLPIVSVLAMLLIGIECVLDWIEKYTK